MELYSISSGLEKWNVVAKSRKEAEDFLISIGKELSKNYCSQFVAVVDYIHREIYDKEIKLREETSKAILWSSSDPVET